MTTKIFIIFAAIFSILLIIAIIFLHSDSFIFEDCKLGKDCPLLCDTHPFASLKTENEKQIFLSSCRVQLVKWITNHPPSNYKYNDDILNHFDFIREFNIRKLANSENIKIKRIANDIAILLEVVYLRGKQYPTLKTALDKDLIDIERISDKHMNYLAQAIEDSEYYEYYLMRKASKASDLTALINEINDRINNANTWLAEDSTSFIFLNSICQGEVSKLYILYKSKNLSREAKKDSLKQYICRADSILLLTWDIMSIKEYEFKKETGNSLWIKYFSDTSIDSLKVDVDQMTNDGLGLKLQAYLNNKCELQTWKMLLCREFGIAIDEGCSKMSLSGHQIMDFSRNTNNFCDVEMEQIHSLMTLSEFYGIKYYCNRKDKDGDLAQQFLQRAADLIYKSNLSYYEKDELIHYANESLLLEKFFKIRPGISFIEMIKRNKVIQ